MSRTGKDRDQGSEIRDQDLPSKAVLCQVSEARPGECGFCRSGRGDLTPKCRFFAQKPLKTAQKQAKNSPFLRPKSSRIAPISYSFIDSYEQLSAYNSSCKMGGWGTWESEPAIQMTF
jgi:hypothetical protein